MVARRSDEAIGQLDIAAVDSNACPVSGIPGQGLRALLAGAGDRRDLLGLQIDFAQQVILGVGDVERVAVAGPCPGDDRTAPSRKSPSAAPTAPAPITSMQLARRALVTTIRL